MNYPVDKVCAWVVKTEPGDKVVLTFETFALEDNSVCQYDYVIIRDGSTSKSPMIGKFCGTSRPATITSTGNFLWIGFRSDSSTTKQGFKAMWKAEKLSEKPPPGTEEKVTTPTMPTGLLIYLALFLTKILWKLLQSADCRYLLEILKYLPALPQRGLIVVNAEMSLRAFCILR